MARDMEFMITLKKGYEENCNIMIACFYDHAYPGLAKQCYVEMDGGRYMICYTSKQNAKAFTLGDDWNIASTKDVLNNLFNKDVIAGLLFNPYTEKMVFIPKAFLEMIMPGDKEKPEFYRNPD